MAEAATKGMNPKILASFKDGTKTMVEMAAVANATGLAPDVPGMHGPKVELADLKRVFIPRKDGGLFAGSGRVDYSTGAIAPGVFAIVYTDEARIRHDMKLSPGKRDLITCCSVLITCATSKPLSPLPKRFCWVTDRHGHHANRGGRSGGQAGLAFRRTDR